MLLLLLLLEFGSWQRFEGSSGFRGLFGAMVGGGWVGWRFESWEEARGEFSEEGLGGDCAVMLRDEASGAPETMALGAAVVVVVVLL